MTELHMNNLKILIKKLSNHARVALEKSAKKTTAQVAKPKKVEKVQSTEVATKLCTIFSAHIFNYKMRIMNNV
jgi:hypothetical protein